MEIVRAAFASGELSCCSVMGVPKCFMLDSRHVPDDGSFPCLYAKQFQPVLLL